MLLFQGNDYEDLDKSTKKTKSKESLFEMAEKKFFGDEELLSEIDKYLKSRKAQKNYPIRNETYANYKNHSFDDDGRATKISDEELAHMWFEYHPKEVI